MEFGLFHLILQGGWAAVSAFFIYILIKLDKRIEKLESKLEEIQKENVSREEYYRDISGWRGELQRLEDKLTNILDKLWEVKK